MGKSIFSQLTINDPKQAFDNAMKLGMKEPNDYMYMNSTKCMDHFKHHDTREYKSYFNYKNMFKK